MKWPRRIISKKEEDTTIVYASPCTSPPKNKREIFELITPYSDQSPSDKLLIKTAAEIGKEVLWPG